MKINGEIARSESFGKLKFPNRTDYVSFLLENSMAQNEAALWSDSELVDMVHRHWHGEGQNGCIFALMAARRATQLGWHNYIVTESISEIDHKVYSRINAKVRESLHDQEVEVLSLVFSKIVAIESFISIIKELLDRGTIREEGTTILDEDTLIELRVELPNSDLSWVMAFGPFKGFPNTRFAPLCEIAIRVKPKPNDRFYRLSDSIGEAHLADLPIRHIPDSIKERIWDSTFKRTANILGHKPNLKSAAKTTLSVPTHLW